MIAGTLERQLEHRIAMGTGELHAQCFLRQFHPAVAGLTRAFDGSDLAHQHRKTDSVRGWKITEEVKKTTANITGDED